MNTTQQDLQHLNEIENMRSQRRAVDVLLSTERAELLEIIRGLLKLEGYLDGRNPPELIAMIARAKKVIE